MTIPYNEFAKYYVEMVDTWRLYQLQARALEGAGEDVPESLENEIRRHNFIVAILKEAGGEIFEKTASQLNKDGRYYHLQELSILDKAKIRKARKNKDESTIN